MNLNPVFYFYWACLSGLLGIGGVVFSWMVRLSFPDWLNYFVRFVTLFLLVSAWVLFTLAFA